MNEPGGYLDVIDRLTADRNALAADLAAANERAEKAEEALARALWQIDHPDDGVELWDEDGLLTDTYEQYEARALLAAGQTENEEGRTIVGLDGSVRVLPDPAERRTEPPASAGSAREGDET